MFIETIREAQQRQALDFRNTFRGLHRRMQMIPADALPSPLTAYRPPSPKPALTIVSNVVVNHD